MPPGHYYIYASAQMDQIALTGYYGANDLTPRAVVTVTAGVVLTNLDINLGLGAFEGG